MSSMTENINVMQANGNHPTSWDEFIGQSLIKDKLQVAAASARLRRELTGQTATMGHMILVSPEPGVGKTTLALLAAAEAGSAAKVVRGVVTEDMALDYFDELGDGGVLVWDEFQQAVAGNAKHIQWLYHYAQHGVFLDGDEVIEAPKVTIICATTHMGKLPTAVKERFSVLNLQPYTLEEASEIAFSTWMSIGGVLGYPSPSEETCEAVALAASRRPRYMQKIWKNIVDLAITGRLSLEGDDCGSCDMDLTVALQWAGLTTDGLTMNCEKYMKYLSENKERPRGREAISRATGIIANDLDETEALLTEKGFISDSGIGRKLTTAGRRRFRDLLAVAA